MNSLPWRVLRRFQHIGLLLLVLLTAYVTLGRLLMPLIATHKDVLESQLGSALGAPVTIGEIKGSWFRFGPSISISNLRIGVAGETAPQHVIARN